MKIAKKLSRVVIALAMCMLLVVTAWAANEIFVTYSATLDDSVLCVNELEKTITLTVAANKTVDGDITMDSLTAQVKLPEIPEGQKGPTLAAISNSDLGFTDSNYNLENGMILWYSGNAESVKNEQLANVSINVPAGTPAGTYEIVFEIIDISRDYGMSWENGTTVTATLTVAGHSDGDDNDHECDYCGGYVEGATCTYVPDEYVWSEDNSTCTVVGTCACGKSATANATVTPSVTAATCMTEKKTTYTAVFDETWAENQTKADVVTGDIDPNNHTGNNHIENQKDATATEDGYTGDLVCECGVTVQFGTTIGKHQVKAEQVDTFTDVPAAVVGGEGAKYESVEAMEAAMTTGTLTEIKKDLPDVAADDVTTEFYDVTLTYYNTEIGEWEEADKEHFPEDGKIVVDIPVPEEIDLAHYSYYVAHVFSETAFGHTAGDIEYPEVAGYVDEEDMQYIRFTVTGLSPISVSYVRNDCDWGLDTEKGTNGYTNGYTVTEENHTAHYECQTDGCTETKDVTEEHAYTDGVCVCGKTEPVAPFGLKGDVNLDGVVDMNDFVALARHIGEVEIITDAQSLENAEVTGDGKVNMEDFVKLAQYLGEVIDEL